MPPDAAWESDNDNYIYIDGDGDGEGTCSMAQAERWHASGRKYKNGADGKPTWIEHPDWHSHSWLTADEFAKCIDLCDTPPQAEYFAVLAAMRELTAHGQQSRVVFWFDN